MSLYQQVCLLFVGRWFYSDLCELQDLSIFTNQLSMLELSLYVCVCMCVGLTKGSQRAKQYCVNLTMSMSAKHTHAELK